MLDEETKYNYVRDIMHEIVCHHLLLKPSDVNWNYDMLKPEQVRRANALIQQLKAELKYGAAKGQSFVLASTQQATPSVVRVCFIH